MNAGELCRELAINRRTLTRWMAAGCPHVRGKGRRGRLTFDHDGVIAWMRRVGYTGDDGRPSVEILTEKGVVGTIDPPAKKKRKGRKAEEDDGDDVVELTRRVNLEIKRLEARKRKRVERAADGELAPVADFRRYWASRCAALHSALRALPDRVARAGGERYEQVFGEAEKAVEDALMPFGSEGEIPW